MMNANETKKIFIPTIGSLGDVKPYLTLAKELQKQGHHVWLGVHPRFVGQINKEGVETVEIGGDMELALSTTPDGIELQRNPSVFKMNLVKRVFLPLMEAWFNGIVDGIKEANLIILSVTSVLAGLSCLDKFPQTKAIGIYTFPCIRTAEFAPPALSGGSTSLFKWINSLKWKLFSYGASNMYGDHINRLRANIGLAPIRLDYDQMIQTLFSRPMVTATIYSKYLLPRPSDWPANDFMVGPMIKDDDYGDFHPSDALEHFLHENRHEKILYIGLGSMMAMMFDITEQKQFLHHIQTAVANNPCRAIISLVGYQNTDLETISNSDKIFYLKETIPHTWLFPKISAAIHHGGAGTTHTSLRYGLPTFIIPFGADQPFNGDRVHLNRLGPKSIPARQINPQNLTNTIAHLLTNYSFYRANAQKIGPLIEQEDGLGHCIGLIEKALRS